MSAFQVYRDRSEQFRWRLRAGNNKTIADCSESYTRKDDCLHGIELVRGGSGEIEQYQDSGGGFRWRLRATNGNIFADSGEGYASQSNCSRAIATVKRVAPGAVLDDRT